MGLRSKFSYMAAAVMERAAAAFGEPGQSPYNPSVPSEDDHPGYDDPYLSGVGQQARAARKQMIAQQQGGPSRQQG